jgi:hypothetical protein
VENDLLLRAISRIEEFDVRMSSYEGGMKRDRERMADVEKQMRVMQEVINQMSEIIKSVMARSNGGCSRDI